METFDALAKLVVIGDSAVGKTCLILRYTQDIFRENFLPTIGLLLLHFMYIYIYLFTFVTVTGVDFKTKVVEVGSKRYKLQLWDTAGQERYDSLRRGFYRGAKVSFLPACHMIQFLGELESLDNFTYSAFSLLLCDRGL